MKNGMKGCNCEGCDSKEMKSDCCAEEKGEDIKTLSKDELQDRKAELKKQLDEVDKALAQSATETA